MKSYSRGSARKSKCQGEVTGGKGRAIQCKERKRKTKERVLTIACTSKRAHPAHALRTIKQIDIIHHHTSPSSVIHRPSYASIASP
jgi:hypothetical protein